MSDPLLPGGEGKGSRGRVARVLPFSAVDGPGNRAVIFLQGCDFDCAYCHNPETRAGSGEGVEELSVQDVVGRFAPYRPFLRGITVSGGECLLQHEFLTALLEASRELGLPGLVDTNGSTPLVGLPRLIRAAEGFMLDVKAWNAEEHRALTGADNRVVLANLRFLATDDKLAEVRTVVCPGSFNLEETVRETSLVLGASGSKAVYRLLRYRPHGVREEKLADLREPDEELMEKLARIALESGAAAVRTR